MWYYFQEDGGYKVVESGACTERIEYEIIKCETEGEARCLVNFLNGGLGIQPEVILTMINKLLDKIEMIARFIDNHP